MEVKREETGNKKSIFRQTGMRHAGFLVGYIITAILLNMIIIICNDRVAGMADVLLTDTGTEIAPSAVFGGMLGFLALMILAGTFTAFIRTYCGNQYSALVQRDVRNSISGRLLRLPFSYFDEQGAGSIMTKLSSDMKEAERFFSEVLPEFLVNLITVVTTTIYFVSMDGYLAVVLFATYPVMVYVSDRLSKRLAAIVKKYRMGMDGRTQAVYDAIQGIEVVRSYGLYEIMCRRIGAAVDEVADHGCRSTRISSMGWLLKGVMTTIPVVLCYLFALHEVMRGQITAGAMLAFAVLLQRVIYPLGDMVFALSDIRTAGVSLGRLEQIFAAEPEEMLHVMGEAAPAAGVEKTGNVGTENAVLAEDMVISWEHIRFSYHGDVSVLKDVSFDIRRGERVAFVGGSGEGKTTIFKLLCRLYMHTEGAYRLYGKPVSEWELSKLRECFAVVSQNTFLLPVSIAENVACAKENATKEEVLEACKAALIHSFIEKLPQGYDTPVGERGVRLSGGERQRISIARAFLKGAPILLLDEPTSAVDVETEREIRQAIHDIAADKTVITIAHRLSTIQDADRIYVVSEGKIAESGSHASLLGQEGIYARLYGKEVSEDAGKTF